MSVPKIGSKQWMALMLSPDLTEVARLVKEAHAEIGNLPLDQ